MPSVLIKITPEVKFLQGGAGKILKIDPEIKFLSLGSAVDVINPLVVYDPASGTEFRSPGQVVKITITDDVEIVLATVSVEFQKTGVWDTVFNGTRFSNAYRESTVQIVSPTEIILNIKRFGGWGFDAVPRFETIAFDKAGNIAQ